MLLFKISSFANGPMVLGIDSFTLMQVLSVLFIAILFTQSGFDKLLNWKANLEWLKEHFSATFFKNWVSSLLLILTIIEIASGVLSLVGVVSILTGNGLYIAYLGVVLSAISILFLFFGQRMAKDYAGAGSLVPYFILIIGTMFLLYQ
jgi:hypothetical protein